ncbi:MAG TPA: DMT family transporter [Ilumatobacteraceae bacterium]|nr:DMT family transporter [Ilumatobacteraceae bacterium]
MGVLFAAISALVYGIGDWCGGHATRRMHAFAVVVVGQIAGMALVLIASLIIGDPFSGVGWGIAAGFSGTLAIICFYSALAEGSMTVVAPVTAVVSLIVPVIVGVLLGDRPAAQAWVGIACALVAVALVGGIVGAVHTPVRRREMILAIAGGLGFGLVFVFLARAPHSAGLWPLVGARCASLSMVIPLWLAVRRTGGGRVVRQAVPFALGSGILDMTANIAYLIAARHALLSIVAVITSMYPVSTVFLALGVDREKVSRSQIVGMTFAVAALVLVSSA